MEIGYNKGKGFYSVSQHQFKVNLHSITHATIRYENA